MIEPDNKEISVQRQCELIGLSRASLYYKPRKDGGFDAEVMRVLDEEYTKTPFYGVRRMVVRVRERGYEVGDKRVRRLLRSMGLMAVYPKKRLSLPNLKDKKYPYLLRGVTVSRPNQVWSVDITYVRLRKGFAYLVAIMDWHSRYVIAWELSLSLESDFCVEALRRALLSGSPEIFNSDQGTQFTSEDFTGILSGAGIRISMDGRGRVYDNIFVERLWRSVKYEEVYLKDYEGVREARESLGRYFDFYNNERPHQALGYRTPREVYSSVEGRWEDGERSAVTRFGLRPTLVTAAVCGSVVGEGLGIHLKDGEKLS
jgi:putative transposase